MRGWKSLVPSLRAELRNAARQGSGVTAVRAASGSTAAVHLGFDAGSYDSMTFCGALDGRERETTDLAANCSACASVTREIGLGHLIKDEDGWTGLYLPRRRR